MGSRMAANLCRAGLRGRRSGTAPASRPRSWPRRTAPRWPRPRREAAAGARRDDHDGGRRPAGRGGAVRRPTARPRGGRGHAGHRHVDDRPGRRPRDRPPGWPSSGVAFIDAPVTGSAPKAEDGTLTIMAGGERGRHRARPAAVRGDGEADRPRRARRARADGQAHQQHPRGDQHGGGGAGARVGRRRGVRPRAAARGGGAPGPAIRRCWPKAGPMLDHDFEPLFKLEHMLKDVRHCLETAREAGVPFGWRPPRNRSTSGLTRPGSRAGTSPRSSRSPRRRRRLSDVRRARRRGWPGGLDFA